MRANHPARSIWLLSALILASGALFCIQPLERTISETNVQSEEELQRAITDERELLDRERVQSLAQHIRAELNGVRIHSTLSESNEALLGDVQRTATRDRLTVTGLKPGFAPQPSAIVRNDSGTPTSPDPLSGAHRDDFDLAVRGSYRDVISFLRDLSHMPTLTRVGSLQLNRSNTEATNQGTPFLDAVIHIQTIRLDHTTIP